VNLESDKSFFGDRNSKDESATKTTKKIGRNVNRKMDEDDDDDDDDDDGDVEKLKKTKKVKVRVKDKIWGYDWMGRPVPCPFEAQPQRHHEMYWENKNHCGDPIRMNLPSPHDLPEEDMDPGLMKVKNIVKELFDKKQKRFKDEAMAELNEIRGRILDIYSRYGIQWSFPDETEDERLKRETRAQKKLALQAKAEAKAAKKESDDADSEEEDETRTSEEPEPVLVGGMPLADASKLTGIPPEKLLLMSEGMQDLMIWLQRKALEEEDRLQLTKEIENSNERAVQRTQVLLEANRWLQALGIDLTNPNIECPYNDVAQNEMHARHHGHTGVNHNIFTRVSKLVAKTVVVGAYILREYFNWHAVAPPPPAGEGEKEDDVNASRLVAEVETGKTTSRQSREEDQDKNLAKTLTKEVQALTAPKGFFTDEELITNADNWKIAVNALDKQFKCAAELTYSKLGREKVDQCKKQAYCIKRTFEQQLSVMSMRGKELEELQSTLKTLQLELYDVKKYHGIREEVIKEKGVESDLWGFRVKELEHAVAQFLRTIQMFDMEYRAAVPKIVKKITEATKYTSHITNPESSKVKDKPEMSAFNAIATSVKELDNKMTEELKQFQEEQLQRQQLLRGRLEAARKKESSGFPPPPSPTTDYSVIQPNPIESKKPKKGKANKGSPRSGTPKRGRRGGNKNFDEDEEESPVDSNANWSSHNIHGKLPSIDSKNQSMQDQSSTGTTLPATIFPRIDKHYLNFD